MLNLKELTDKELKALEQVVKGIKAIRSNSGYGQITVNIQKNGEDIIVNSTSSVKIK